MFYYQNVIKKCCLGSVYQDSINYFASELRFYLKYLMEKKYLFLSDLALVVLLGGGGGSTSDSAPDSELLSFSPFLLLFFFLLLCFLCFLFFLWGTSVASLVFTSSFSGASSSPVHICSNKYFSYTTLFKIHNKIQGKSSGDYAEIVLTVTKVVHAQ